jgi:hypothetical protein
VSTYQCVVFRAVDGPLSDEQLAFAQRQSTRAEVSRWSLSVDYHYSSFRGDVDGLLRGGYDVYLQYTNYGSREIKLRLPVGLPFAKTVWGQYVDGRQLAWNRDAKGSRGILTLCPSREAGELMFLGHRHFSTGPPSSIRRRSPASQPRIPATKSSPAVLSPRPICVKKPSGERVEGLFRGSDQSEVGLLTATSARARERPA